jgi:hypothetical protein
MSSILGDGPDSAAAARLVAKIAKQKTENKQEVLIGSALG